LTCSAFTAATFWRKELTSRFSDSGVAAHYLQQSGLAERRLVFSTFAAGMALLPYLPGKTAWDAQRGERGRYLKWDRRFKETESIPLNDVMPSVARMNPRWDDRWEGIVLVANAPFKESSQWGLKLEYQTPGNIFRNIDEQYYIYLPVKKNGPEAANSRQ